MWAPDAAELSETTYLRSGVTGGSTGSLQRLILLIHVRKTKIDDFERVVVVKEQVLRLQITMADTTLVEVLDAADEFPVELGCLLLIQACISDDKVKKFTTICMLHDHEKLLLSLNNLHNSNGQCTGEQADKLERSK